MKNLIIQLSNGSKITIEGFYMAPTYSGLLLGQPNEDLNDEILKSTTYPSAWGTRKAVYKQRNINKSKTELMPYMYSTWLSSMPVNDFKNQYNGSGIVMVWFGDEPLNKSIVEIIKNELENFDWDKHAENFNL